MKKIFEAGEIELADLHGDPSRVLEIQQKVKELLSTNRQRREVLKQEIIEKGAWALPGLINSTYTWMKKVESDKELRNLMSDMMVSVAKDNDAASRLIFQAGVIENPFPAPRAIAINALEKLNWKPNPDDTANLREHVKRAEKNLDNAAVLDFYSIILMTGDTQDMETVLVKCRDWVTKEDGGNLFARLIKAFPNDVETIVVSICDDLRKKRKYKDSLVAEMLVGNLKPIPVKWIVNGTLINISIRALPGKPPRHTVVEFLWRDVVKELCSNHGIWDSSIESVESAVYTSGKNLRDSQVKETLYRYWFQSLNLSDKSSQERIYNAAKHEEDYDEDWGIAATAVIFRMSTREKNHNAKQSLQEIEERYPIRYERAKEKFQNIGSKGPSDGVEIIDEISGLGKG